MALKTYIRGLTGQIQNNIRLRNPESLEKAMSLVIEEENFFYSQRRSNSLNSKNSFRMHDRITPTRPSNFRKGHFRPNKNFQNNYQQPFNYFSSSFNNYQYGNHYNNSYAPPTNHQNYRFQQPFHQNFRQNTAYNATNSQRTRNSKQNFGNFNNRNSSQMYEPEPMETSSGYLKQRGTPNHNHIFEENLEHEQHLFENPFENSTNSNIPQLQYDIQGGGNSNNNI